MRRVVVFVERALAAAVVAVAGVALVAAVLVPRLAGATPYTVLTGSMAPAYPAGTLVVVRPSDSIALGDVVTYQLRSGEPEVVTHRVVGVGTSVDGERRYTTKGDANPVADPDLVRDVQVRGEVWYRVPYLGHVSALFTGQQRQWAGTGLAVLLAGYAAWQVVRLRAERRAGSRGAAADDERATSAPEERLDSPPPDAGARAR